MLSLVMLIMIHKSVFTSVSSQLDNYKLDLQFSEVAQCNSFCFFSPNIVFLEEHCDTLMIFFHHSTRTTVIY